MHSSYIRTSQYAISSYNNYRAQSVLSSCTHMNSLAHTILNWSKKRNDTTLIYVNIDAQSCRSFSLTSRWWKFLLLTGSINEPCWLLFPVNEDKVHGNSGQDNNCAYTHCPWWYVEWKDDQESANYEKDDWQS